MKVSRKLIKNINYSHKIFSFFEEDKLIGGLILYRKNDTAYSINYWGINVIKGYVPKLGETMLKYATYDTPEGILHSEEKYASLSSHKMFLRAFNSNEFKSKEAKFKKEDRIHYENELTDFNLLLLNKIKPEENINEMNYNEFNITILSLNDTLCDLGYKGTGSYFNNNLRKIAIF